jgi:hypothetical protein
MEGAIAAWNTRPGEKALAEALEACEKQMVNAYRAIVPSGNTETGNVFADKDEAVLQARAALAARRG